MSNHAFDILPKSVQLEIDERCKKVNKKFEKKIIIDLERIKREEQIRKWKQQ